MKNEKVASKELLGENDYLTTERIQNEKESRAERVEMLSKLVDELFEGEANAELRNKIKRAFNVPQWGEYHNEGVLMDTHLARMIEIIDEFENGHGGNDLPTETKETFHHITKTYGDTLKKYVFLHDISKPDLLRIQWTPKEGEKKGRAWEGNIEQFTDELGVPLEVAQDPVKLAEYLRLQEVKGISYYHQGMKNENGRETTKNKHGEHGAEHVGTEHEGVVDPGVLKAIELHEAAYQFEKYNPSTYQKLFGELSEEHRHLALFASYIDTSSSYRENGKPDLSNFLFLLKSKNNAAVLGNIQKNIQSLPGLDKKKVEAFLKALSEQQSDLSEDLALEKAKKECKLTEYDLVALGDNLQELVSKGSLSNEEAIEIHAFVAAGAISEIGKKFGKKMKELSPVLKASEKND